MALFSFSRVCHARTLCVKCNNIAYFCNSKIISSNSDTSLDQNDELSMPGYTNFQKKLKSAMKYAKKQKQLLCSSKPSSVIAGCLKNVHVDVTTTDIKSEQHDEKSLHATFNSLKSDLNAIYSKELSEIARLKYEPILKQGSRIVSKYGSEDANLPISRQPCYGCGALLQANNICFQGFVPAETFIEVMDDYELLRNVLCLRCDLMKRYNKVLDVSMDDSHIKNVFQTIKYSCNSLILCVVDITRIPDTIIPNLTDLVGCDKKIVIIVNKIDVIPPDSVSFERRWKGNISKLLCTKYGYNPEAIAKLLFVSAKTGYNIENLINFLLEREFNRQGNVYILGYTNVGKSCLFNSLLESDFCKIASREIIHKATISKFPGTTLDTLKFPITRMTNFELLQRAKRLRDQSILHEKKTMKSLSSEIKKSNILGAPVGFTFDASKYVTSQRQDLAKQLPAYSYDTASKSFDSAVEDAKLIQSRFISWPEIDERQFSKWCIDTPGIKKTYYIEQFLNEKEDTLIHSLKKQWVPRTFVVKRGMSLLIGGLARLDVLEIVSQHLPSVYLTCQSPLPNIHLIDTSNFASYMDQYAEFVYLPGERPSELPDFVMSELDISSGRKDFASHVDVVFAHLGWIAISSPVPLRIAVGMPGSAENVRLREPSLFNLAVRLRGERYTMTKEFSPSMTLQSRDQRRRK